MLSLYNEAGTWSRSRCTFHVHNIVTRHEGIISGVLLLELIVNLTFLLECVLHQVIVSDPLS
jgi:hypothetical protein